MIKHIPVVLTISLFLVLLPFCLNGQEVMKITRYTGFIEFDGKPFEDAWDGVDYFPLVMQQPNFGAAPLENSEIMLTYDNEFVWVGARLFMKNVDKIVANSKKRDELLLYSDSFAVFLDSYNDNENGMVFYTMPSGLRTDYTVSNDAVRTTGTPFNFSWNTFWDVKTSKDEKGWYVEMRIPFSSLRFKPEDNLSKMGVIFRRVMSNNHETDTYPAIDPKYETSIKPSLAVTIEFEGAQPSRPVYVSPYVIGGFTRDWKLNSDQTKYVPDDTPDWDAGLDLKYNISSNLILDLTANTDFAQVEADDQQVNLTRYSLYFPEKRLFFQERAGLFSFSLGGRSNLFYSRNIGLSAGEPIRIYGGARLMGRVGKWDMGLMDMQTEEHKENPGENFGIFRLRRQVINENSFVGGIFTSRIGMDGATNLAYGLDGTFKIFRDDYFDLKIAQTYDDKIGNKIASADPVFLSAIWERRSIKGLGYQMGYKYSGEEFMPGIGFMTTRSIQGYGCNVFYGWMPGPESGVFSLRPEIDFTLYKRLTNGSLESLSIAPMVDVETKSGFTYNFTLTYQKEGVIKDFPITDSVLVMEGEYEFTDCNFSFQTPTSKAASFTLGIYAGQFYDGNRYGFTAGPEYNVSPSLQISGSYQYYHINFPDRDGIADIHIASAKITYMLNTKLSASVFMQYANTSEELITNFRLRFNPREGNDFYIVLNENRQVTDEKFIPELPDYNNRTILLKYTHTFIF
jgi:hypothetical protein